MLNKKEIKDFLLYVVVGGIATLIEWVIFYLLNTWISLHYMICTAVAYVISTFVNWLFGRILLFKKKDVGITKEIISIYLTSIIGLLGNLAIMWVTVDLLKTNESIAKIIATGIVFMWNYIVRKCVIYRR